MWQMHMQIRVASFLKVAFLARLQWEDADDVEDEWETAEPDQAVSAAGAVGSFDVEEEQAEAGQIDPWIDCDYGWVTLKSAVLYAVCAICYMCGALFVAVVASCITSSSGRCHDTLVCKRTHGSHIVAGINVGQKIQLLLDIAASSNA